MEPQPTFQATVAHFSARDKTYTFSLFKECVRQFFTQSSGPLVAHSPGSQSEGSTGREASIDVLLTDFSGQHDLPRLEKTHPRPSPHWNTLKSSACKMHSKNFNAT